MKTIESEKVLEKKLVREVENRGGWCIKLLPFLIRGLPDRLCLLPGGIVFFVEVKTTGKKESPVQKIVHKKLKDLKFSVYIVDDSETIKSISNYYKYALHAK